MRIRGGLLLIGGIMIMAIVVGAVLILDSGSNLNKGLSSRGADLGDDGEENINNPNGASYENLGVEESSMGGQVGTSDGQGCYDRQISYSTGGLVYESICEEYSGSECISKELNCSLSVKNLDKGISGKFIIEFRAIPSGNREAVLSSSQVSQNVSSKTEELFQTSLKVSGEAASQDIICEYSSKEVPKELICN